MKRVSHVVQCSFVCAICTALLGQVEHASACGVSGPDNVWSCSLEEHNEAERPKWFAGVAAVHTWTELRFNDELRVDQTRSALVATAGYAPTSRVTLQASAGVALGGELRTGERRYDFSPGPNVAAGVAYRLVDGFPFVTLSALFSGTTAKTELRGESSERATYSAFDLRLGVLAGTRVFDILRPYLVGRLFGGPVLWTYRGSEETGTDVSHFQLGAGLSLALVDRLVIGLEGAPLGERALSGGITLALD
jgi:opacity protein-like surface antigen